jgi:hypothetical protein
MAYLKILATWFCGAMFFFGLSEWGLGREAGVQTSPISELTKVERPFWLRADTGLSFMQSNRDMTSIAYIPVGDSGVRVMEIASGKIYQVTRHPTVGSFFWAPDKARLFFRELDIVRGKAQSRVRAWDAGLKKVIDIEVIEGSSGMLSYDPRDHRMMLMHDKGIMTKRLLFPDDRLAAWQSAQRHDKGKWVAAAGGMTFVTQQGFAMSRLQDDASGVESFDISPTGNLAVWATRAGKIYASRQGEPPLFLGYGRDPKWHPSKEIIVMAGAHMVGTKASSYDIKIVEIGGSSSFMTSTQDRSERWPMWTPKGDSIAYTIDGTTDVFKLALPQGFAQ